MKHLMSFPDIVVPSSCDGKDRCLYVAARVDTCEDDSSFFLPSFISAIYIFYCVVLPLVVAVPGSILRMEVGCLAEVCCPFRELLQADMGTVSSCRSASMSVNLTHVRIEVLMIISLRNYTVSHLEIQEYFHTFRLYVAYSVEK